MTSCKRSLIESRITRVTNRTHHSYSVMADMEDALAVAVDKAVRNFFPKVKELSCQQFEIMKSIFILQKDTFAVLPTGHGKSLPFQIAPFVAKELGPLKEFDFVKTKDIILIIPPLLVIMDMQAKTLNSVGIPACCLHHESLDADEILSGENCELCLVPLNRGSKPTSGETCFVLPCTKKEYYCWLQMRPIVFPNGKLALVARKTYRGKC